MRAQLKYLSIIIAGIIINAGCSNQSYDELEKISYEDNNHSFSIIAPKSWQVQRKSENDFSSLELKSIGKFDIQLTVTSRDLSTNERNLQLLELIDYMMNSSINNLKGKECQIVNVGKAREFVKDCPTFVITAITKSGKHSLTQWGTVVNDRNYSINLMTLNIEASDELSEIARKLVESIKILTN